MNTILIEKFQEQKEALAEYVCGLTRLIDKKNFSEMFEAILKNLAEKHLRLVVLDQFKRGKTTLINSLFGRPILSADVVPVRP